MNQNLNEKPDSKDLVVFKPKVIKACAHKASIDRRLYCHLLRHSGAIARLNRTGNPKSLQIHLGHADMKMTTRYLATMQVVESLETDSQVNFDR
jgi:integrase/recombinase XerD